VEHSNNIYEPVYLAIPTPMLLLQATPDFTIISANNAFCKATFQQPAALKGKPLFEAFPNNPDNSDANGITALSATLHKAIETGESQLLEEQRFAIKTSGNTYERRYWTICCTPIKDAEGKVVSIVNTVSDVTTEHLFGQRSTPAEQNMSDSLQRLGTANEARHASDEANILLHAIIDAAQVGVFLITPIQDKSGKIVDFRFDMVNRMLAAYVGQEPAALNGSLASKWFPGYAKNGLFEKYRQTAETGAINRFEFHYNEDGLDVWLDILSKKVNGNILVTFTDFTAMKNLQRRLEEHVAELRSSNTNLEQFAYIASHDLQEPLRKVKSFGDMLQARYGELLGDSGTDLIGRMQSAAARMGTLIDDLLTYSRASVKPNDLSVIDANKILDGVLLDLERAIQQKQAIIRKDKLLPVVGKETQIGQIFLNLIGNALKFHKPDQRPEITITSGTAKGKDSGVRVAPEDLEKDFQLVRISDNGIGFDNSYKDRIFQIFQRLNNRSDFPGSGVGLSIVKKVLENHGGYIDANAELGKGAEFSILLPLIQAEVY
jgi:signal transduction histidine kinase